MDNDWEKLINRRNELAREYHNKMKELVAIKKRKVFEIIKLLPEHKSNNKAELYWQATEDGQKELEIEYYCKGLIELIRSTKSELDIRNVERFN